MSPKACFNFSAFNIISVSCLFSHFPIRGTRLSFVCLTISHIYLGNKDLLKHSFAYLFIIYDGFFAIVAELMDVKETTWVSDLESAEELSQNIKSLTKSLPRLLHTGLAASALAVSSYNPLTHVSSEERWSSLHGQNNRHWYLVTTCHFCMKCEEANVGKQWTRENIWEPELPSSNSAQFYNSSHYSFGKWSIEVQHNIQIMWCTRTRMKTFVDWKYQIKNFCSANFLLNFYLPWFQENYELNTAFY